MHIHRNIINKLIPQSPEKITMIFLAGLLFALPCSAQKKRFFDFLFPGKAKTETVKPDSSAPSPDTSQVGPHNFISDMIYVEGGTFDMGKNDGQYDEKPIHEVTLSGFYIGKFEVTQYQWREVMGNEPSFIRKCDCCPVEQVSWIDVQGFILKLNQVTHRTFRLPTEAEWEYAAGGGNKSKKYSYSGGNGVGEVAWFNNNSDFTTHPVGQKEPNELGLFDMSGNVWEWCSDWYGPYPSDPQTDPAGPAEGSYRVLRGGSWNGVAQGCRISNRIINFPATRYGYLGFRLAMDP